MPASLTMAKQLKQFSIDEVAKVMLQPCSLSRFTLSSVVTLQHNKPDDLVRRLYVARECKTFHRDCSGL